MPKITKRTVEALKPSDRDVLAWDDELRGFGVRVKPSGTRSYLVQYRNAQGRSRRLTIGNHCRLTTEQARKEARLLLAEVERGGDPAETRDAARKAPTMAELCDRYLANHADTRKKEKSVYGDRRMIERFISPTIGKRKVADVTRADVHKLHHGLRGTPYQANRALALFSKMMNLAEKWGLRPDGSNPCRHVEKFKEQKRERFLSADELGRLAGVLAEGERTATELPSVIAAIRLLVLTGCRLSEILTLRWEHVDFPNACLRLPDSKTGAKVVHLNAPALEVLSGLERLDGCPWVILGAKTEKPKDRKHLVNLEKPWRRIRAKATVRLWESGALGSETVDIVKTLRTEKDREPTLEECVAEAKRRKIELPQGLVNVRLHDLRHSFASVAVGLGEGLPMIGKLLGHTQTQTTARYAHLAADPVKAATERVGAALAGMMNGKGAEVVELPQRQR